MSVVSTYDRENALFASLYRAIRVGDSYVCVCLPIVLLVKCWCCHRWLITGTQRDVESITMHLRCFLNLIIFIMKYPRHDFLFSTISKKNFLYTCSFSKPCHHFFYYEIYWNMSTCEVWYAVTMLNCLFLISSYRKTMYPRSLKFSQNTY